MTSRSQLSDRRPKLSSAMASASLSVRPVSSCSVRVPPGVQAKEQNARDLVEGFRQENEVNGDAVAEQRTSLSSARVQDNAMRPRQAQLNLRKAGVRQAIAILEQRHTNQSHHTSPSVSKRGGGLFAAAPQA